MDATGKISKSEPSDAQSEIPHLVPIDSNHLRETKSQKSVASKTPKKKSLPSQKISPENLQDFLNDLLLNPKKSPAIDKIPESDLKIATELKNAFLNHDYKIKTPLDFELIGMQKLQKLVKVSSNNSFLFEVFVKYHGLPSADLAITKILRASKNLPELLQGLELHSKKPNFQNMVLHLSLFLKSNTDEFKELRWWLLLHVSETNLQQYSKSSAWGTLKGKSEEFLALPGIQLSQILRKTFKDRVLFLEFLIHLEIQKSSKGKLDPLRKVLEGVTAEDILALRFSSKVEINRSFIEILFMDSFQNKLDLTRTLEGCLPFYLIDGIYPDIFGGDRIKRSWKRVQLIENGLIEKFRSDEVNRISNELEQIKSEFLEKSLALEEAVIRQESTQKELDKSHSALQNLEDRLRERVSGQNSGNLAIERQIRINQLRSVVEVMESEISRETSSRIPVALERIGIKRIGIPGESIKWDNSVCESITGMEITDPVVIKSGYTWDESGEKTVLSKVLVKPKK